MSVYFDIFHSWFDVKIFQKRRIILQNIALKSTLSRCTAEKQSNGMESWASHEGSIWVVRIDNPNESGLLGEKANYLRME